MILRDFFLKTRRGDAALSEAPDGFGRALDVRQ